MFRSHLATVEVERIIDITGDHQKLLDGIKFEWQMVLQSHFLSYQVQTVACQESFQQFTIIYVQLFKI